MDFFKVGSGMGKLLSTAFLVVFSVGVGFAQCTQTRELCAKELQPYVSDGQFRSAILKKGEKRLFKSTFYGGRKYKLVVGANNKPGNVRFKILNSYSKILFDSAQHGMPSSWKLNFKNTADFYLEISLDENAPDGCAVILVGFDVQE